MMRKEILFTLLTMFVLLLLSCSSDDTIEEKPSSELIVLITENAQLSESDCICDPYINQYTWRGKEIYVLAYKGPVCDWVPSYYHTNGQKFNMEEGYTYTDFLEESTLVEGIWACND